MDIYSKIFSGFFAYLLIGQIFLVSGLMLYLLGMMARRIKTLSGADSSAPLATVTNISSAVDPGVEKELREKISKLEAENSQLQAGGGGAAKDQNALVDKIKYLESKLLEYEILQEEIGQLSNLKNENESLRTKLQDLETQSKNPPKAA